MNRRTCIGICFLVLFLAPLPVRAWTYIDSTQIPALPIAGLVEAIRQINDLVDKNGKNYPPAFLMANVGGMPLGSGTLGGTPHFFIGVAGSIGCANLKYYDETILRTQGVYPAYAPNPVIYMGVGLPLGFDLVAKFMIFTGSWYKPTYLNSKKFNYVTMNFNEVLDLKKLNISTAGIKLRKNIIKPMPILPGLLGFGGLTFVAGWDYMEGIVAISGFYKYTLNGIFINPPGANFNVRFDAWYNASVKWVFHSYSFQALAYLDALKFLGLYAGVGFALNHGLVRLDTSAVGTATELTGNTTLGNLYAMNRSKYVPRLFMGLFTAGLEIRILWFKINVESMVNLSNGADINLTLGTRFQY